MLGVVVVAGVSGYLLVIDELQNRGKGKRMENKVLPRDVSLNWPDWVTTTFYFIVLSATLRFHLVAP